MSALKCISLIVIVSGWLTNAANAGKVYNCVVTQFFNFKPDIGVEGDEEAVEPLVQGDPKTDFEAEFHIGKRFSVDVQTGVLIGEIMNVTAPNVKRYVIRKGDTQNSFELLEVWGLHNSTRYTIIAEYDRKGAKPFVILDAGDVLSGECW